VTRGLGSLVSVSVAVVSAFLLVNLSGCVTESHEALPVEKPQSASYGFQVPKRAIAIGKFDNRSTYLQGAFSDGVDRLGGEARTILVGHLQETGRFDLMDRDNLPELARESQITGQSQELQGADFIITGDVVEFGRRETGDEQLFGMIGDAKHQMAYSKVTLNVVDVRTSKVVYSVSGAGDYTLTNREVLGIGTNAGYDSTLNGKVLDLAIREAVDRLVEGMANGGWSLTRTSR
jgi:curli biogenesis system outer membrane secretion channel CsgG